MIRMSKTYAYSAMLAAAVLLAGSQPALAQSGGGKDTKKLQEEVQKSRESLQSAVGQVKETMEQYNTVFAEGGKGPESAYKELPKSIDKCDKAAEDARKSVESLRKDLQDFYKGWEKEIASYSSESMKERSQKSLDRVKTTFNNFDAALQGASELYKPFIASLRDQSTFMGRDLSPAALAELKPDADQLNQDAEALYAKVDEAIAASDPSTAPAADEGGETAGEEPAAGETTGAASEAGGETEESGGE